MPREPSSPRPCRERARGSDTRVNALIWAQRTRRIEGVPRRVPHGGRRDTGAGARDRGEGVGGAGAGRCADQTGDRGARGDGRPELRGVIASEIITTTEERP